MNSFLDWIVVALPFVGSLYLAIYPPKRFRWEVIAFGLTVSILTFVQQSRSRNTHNAEIQAMNARFEETSQDLKNLPPLLEKYLSARNADEAKLVGDAIRQGLQQAQMAARPPSSPSNATATAN